jgi:hypothetical protein
MIVISVDTSSHTWACQDLDRLDAFFKSRGIRVLNLDWKSFRYIRDGIHFTRDGYQRFSTSLAQLVKKALPHKDINEIYIFADSTVGHGGSEANLVITKAFEAQHLHATVDAVCGSGFMSMHESGQHFYPRVKRQLQRVEDPSRTAVLLIGGWNDVWHPFTFKNISYAVDGILRIVRKSDS